MLHSVDFMRTPRISGMPLFIKDCPFCKTTDKMHTQSASCTWLQSGTRPVTEYPPLTFVAIMGAAKVPALKVSGDRPYTSSTVSAGKNLLHQLEALATITDQAAAEL